MPCAAPRGNGRRSVALLQMPQARRSVIRVARMARLSNWRVMLRLASALVRTQLVQRIARELRRIRPHSAWRSSCSLGREARAVVTAPPGCRSSPRRRDRPGCRLESHSQGGTALGQSRSRCCCSSARGSRSESATRPGRASWLEVDDHVGNRRLPAACGERQEQHVERAGDESSRRGGRTATGVAPPHSRRHVMRARRVGQHRERQAVRGFRPRFARRGRMAGRIGKLSPARTRWQQGLRRCSVLKSRAPGLQPSAVAVEPEQSSRDTATGGAVVAEPASSQGSCGTAFPRHAGGSARPTRKPRSQAAAAWRYRVAGDAGRHHDSCAYVPVSSPRTARVGPSRRRPSPSAPGCGGARRSLEIALRVLVGQARTSGVKMRPGTTQLTVCPWRRKAPRSSWSLHRRPCRRVGTLRLAT